MSREKAFISILMVLILIVLSGASVWAAPRQDVITGDVQNIVIEDQEGTPIVVVTLLVDGTEQEFRLSVDTAKELGLLKVENGNLVLDDQGKPIPDETKYGTTVYIDSDDVIGDGEEDGEEGEHPVALALAGYFGEELDIMGAHEAGFGFGLIAQACWMSYALKGDATLFREILDDKQDGNGFEITLPGNGTTMTTTITAKNWGQFRKAVLRSDDEKVKKNLANLGAIMSGRAKGGQDETGGQGELGATSTQGQGKGKKGKGPGEDGPPGKNKDKGGGNPKTPPGKENKGGGKGGGKKK
jgi:hypothetical protein